MCTKNTASCTYVTPSKNKNLKVEQRGPAAFLLSTNLSFTVPVMDWQKKKHAPFWQHKQTFTNIKDLHSLPMKNGVGFCARRNPGRAPVHKHPTHRHSGVQLPVHPRRCTSCQSPPGIEGTGSGNAQFKSPVGTGHGCEALLLTEGSCFDAYWISQSHTGFPSHCKLLTDGGDGGV